MQKSHTQGQNGDILAAQNLWNVIVHLQNADGFRLGIQQIRSGEKWAI
jgi:hypothetical protein